MAVWMETGSVVSRGRIFSSAASTSTRSRSKNSGAAMVSDLPGVEDVRREDCGRWRSGLVVIRLKGFRDNFPIRFLQQDFDPTFRFFELLLAFARKLDAFFEELHGFVEREVGAFEALDHFFQARERFFEVAFPGRLGGGRGRFVWYRTHSASMGAVARS